MLRSKNVFSLKLLFKNYTRKQRNKFGAKGAKILIFKKKKKVRYDMIGFG